MGFSKLTKASVLALALAFVSPTTAVPRSAAVSVRQDASGFWMNTIQRQGKAAFAAESDHQVFRNVKDFGAKGDGVTDDTHAINKAVQQGQRCMSECDSKTTTPALVYFPTGTYLVSEPLVQTYYTQFIGDAINLPILKATASFQGVGVIDSNPYYPGEAVGRNWFQNQNNFFRQVRNFVIDIQDVRKGQPVSGIHWQVAQATSLQNIVFNMDRDLAGPNQQKGIYMENGSGGFMANLTFNGGLIGAHVGSQQFTTRDMTFNNCGTAIAINWNWAWTMSGITVNNCQIGIDLSSGGIEEIKVGSLVLMDSKMSNTPVGIRTLYRTDMVMTNNTLIMDNVDMTKGVESALQYAGDNHTLIEGGQMIASFAQGRLYLGDNAAKTVQTMSQGISKPEGIMSNGKVFTRVKPQYCDVPASRFKSVKACGAKGDGKTDDTAAIQGIFDDVEEGEIIYFDHGAYLIYDTIKVPGDKKIKVVGEMWPLIMSAGTKFSDESNPKAVWQIGTPGEVGDVEISDLIFQTKGAQPGAIMMQYNLAGSHAGSAGLWDVHFRIGGTAGTDLQSDKCLKNPNVTTVADPDCIGSFLMFHVTKTASVYVENCWFWVADHELDIPKWSQINLYNGRGVLIESQKPVWFWGTASEHSQLYNYQISNARNVWLGLIQTETAYMQGNPDATTPFKVNQDFFDPDFAESCKGKSSSCARTWGLRVTNSTDVYVYGAGLYSFFENYDQDCVKKQSCQENIVSIECSTVHMFGVSTKASVNMLTLDGSSVALDKDNRNTFGAGIAKFDSLDGPNNAGTCAGVNYGNGTDSDSGSNAGSSSSSMMTSTVGPQSPTAAPTYDDGSQLTTTIFSGTMTSSIVMTTTQYISGPAPTQTVDTGSGTGSGTESAPAAGSTPVNTGTGSGSPVPGATSWVSPVPVSTYATSPSSDLPAAGTPAPASPSYGTPSSGSPAAATPAPASPSTGTPSSGSPGPGSPSTGALTSGTPSSELPAAGSPAPGSPSSEAPSSGSPAPGSPVFGSSPESPDSSDNSSEATPSTLPTGTTAVPTTSAGVQTSTPPHITPPPQTATAALVTKTVTETITAPCTTS